MDSTAPISSLYWYKETRIPLDPSVGQSIIHLQLPSVGAFARTTRVVRKVLDAITPSKIEDEFKNKHVATSSSLFFKGLESYPRALLWRCLENSNVLELRSVDCSKDEQEHREAYLTLRFGFPNKIRNGCVALADCPDEDKLIVFVITTANELYTLTLRPTFFCHPTTSEDDLENWCKTFKPSSLAISHPHKMFAKNSSEVLISLGDGRLARLTKRKGDDGSNWTEAAYSDGHWTSSLRGLIRWQAGHTVKFEGNSLDQNSIIAASTAPDGQHIFAVALNHSMKAWNVESGKRTISTDILGVNREPQDVLKMMLDPGITKNMHLFESQSFGGYLYFAITFSPHSSGLFKIWGIRDADDNESGMRDLFAEDNLRLPDPDDGALWTVLDFDIRNASDSTELDIWILMRLNRRYKVYARKFPELQTLGEEWSTGWTITVIDAASLEPSNEPPLRLSEFDQCDIPTRWLDYIFMPGSVPMKVLETSLSIYAQSRDLILPKSSKGSLRERIASCVGSQIYLQSSDPSTYNFSKFHTDLSSEWNGFWNIVTDIDQSRWEPQSLVLDTRSNIPWISLSDGCSAIRDCSHVELVAHNNRDDLASQHLAIMPSVEVDNNLAILRSPDELALLIDSAKFFRESFSESLKLSCENAMLEELWTDASYSVSTRIQNFYDRCKFEPEISDGQYNDLASSLKEIGGFDGLSTEALVQIVESVPASMSRSSKLVSTRFGVKALVRGGQDMISVHLRVLTDILWLITFIDVEIDREEFTMNEFDASSIWEPLLAQLRQVHMARWLATNSRCNPHTIKNNAGEHNLSGADSTGPLTPNTVSSVLENLFASDVNPQSYENQMQSSAFTHTIRDLLTWVAGGNQIPLTEALVSIQCDFLKNGNIDLATSFQLFQPSNAWATYIRGRLCLLRHDFTGAAICFKKAAFKLSRPMPPSSKYTESSCAFLDAVTASFLSTGLLNYYDHIVNLFSALHVHTQTVHFSQIALQQRQHEKPDQRSDILARLFHASITLEDYDVAYSALTRYTDRALQKAALATLISEMASNGAVTELLRFPFLNLQKDVDEWLVAKARAEVQTPAVAGAIPFFKVLYAWRLRQGDFRAAAAVLVERLEARKSRGGTVGSKIRGQKEAEMAMDEYLVGINALVLVGGEDEEGWVFIEGESGKRRVVRLSDLRSEYDEEMDRMGILEMGRFGIVGDDEDADMYD